MGDQKTADTVYARRPYGATPMVPFIEKSGFASNEERLVSEALESLLVPVEQLRELRPPLTQIELFPPRFGYDRNQPTMMDIMQLSRATPDARYQRSGEAGSYSGSSTPANNWW